MSTQTSAQLAYELRETLGRVVRRVRAESGVGASRLLVLSRIDRQGPQSVADLAAAESMRPQSMAQTVRDLEDAGLVSRRPDPDDKRRAFVELTDAGLANLHAVRHQRESWLSQQIDARLDDDERALLRDALAVLDRLVS